MTSKINHYNKYIYGNGNQIQIQLTLINIEIEMQWITQRDKDRNIGKQETKTVHWYLTLNL